MDIPGLNETITHAFEQLRKGRENYSFSLKPGETGTVIGVSTGIASVSGLPGVGFEELLKLPTTSMRMRSV
jgi:F-type H+-transporting ATPase subunit alpha